MGHKKNFSHKKKLEDYSLTEKRIKQLSQLQEQLSIRFLNMDLFNQSLTHSSYFSFKEKSLKKDNQRLEFLGDSFLSLVVSDFLYKTFPSLKEGELSKIKNYIVSEKILHKISARLNLGNFLLMSYGELKNKGNEKPAALADAFEALVGALYLDQGLTKASQFLTPIIEAEIDLYFNEKWLSVDYKSELQYLIQKKYKIYPIYTLESDKGPNHNKEFTINLSILGKVYAQSTGKTKKTAEQEAAKIVFNKIRLGEIDL